MLAQGQSSSAKTGGLAAVSSGLIFLKKKKRKIVAPYMGGKEEAKTEAGPSGLVGGRFNKQGQLTCEACLGRPQDEMISQPARILRVYLKSLNGVQSGLHPDALNTTVLSQGHALKWLLMQGKRAERTFHGQGRVRRRGPPGPAPGQSSRRPPPTRNVL